MKMRCQLVLLSGLVLLLLTSNHSFGQGTDRLAPTQPVASNRPSSSSGASSIIISDARVSSMHKIEVAAQADGLVDKLMVDEGHTVKKGDTLLVIDNRLALAELGVAQKEWEMADKQAKQTAEVDYAKKAADLSDVEYAEITQLVSKGSANPYEGRRKQLEKERAHLQIDVSIVKHEQEILAAEVAKEKVHASQVQLDLFKVLAPYDGVIVQRMRDQGEWIRAGETVLRLVSMDEMKVEAHVRVDGISVANLQGAPMTVAVRINGQELATYTDTRVEVVSPEIVAGRVVVSTRIHNQKLGGSWLLRDGITATVEIALPN